MAESPYSPIPDVAPETRTPEDYSDVQPKAAEGMEQAGAGALKAGQFWGQVQTDDAVNNYLTSANQIVAHFKSLNGADALNAQAPTEAALDKAATDAGASLGTFEQQHQFDTVTRSYRQRYFAGQLSSHADEAAKAHATETNSNTLNNAITMVTNSPDDDANVLGAREDARQAAVRQLQVSGEENTPGAVQSAITKADRAVYTARVKAVAVNDPVRAAAMVDQYKDTLGPEYPELAASIRGRVDQASGLGAADQALGFARQKAVTTRPYADPSLPIYQQTAEAIPGGFSSRGLARTIQIESGGNPNAGNKSGHVGLGQFSQATWNQYGRGDRADPVESIAATQRYAAANSQYLTRQLGRPPTDAELYLAHQEGPGGAAAILKNPDALARDTVGLGAVVGNGGTPNMTNAQFASMWTHKFDGTSPAAVGTPTTQSFGISQDDHQDIAFQAVPLPAAFAFPDKDQPPPVPEPGLAPAAPAAPALAGNVGSGIPAAPSPIHEIKGDAYQHIIDLRDAGKITPGAASYALTVVNQQVMADQLRQQTNTAAAKAANEAAANGYTKRMLNHQFDGLWDDIANDPSLEHSTRLALEDSLVKWGGADAQHEAAEYGPGYMQAYQRVLAPAGDPSRISDISQIYRLAVPGGGLTLQGATKLQEIFSNVSKSVNDKSLEDAKAGVLKSYESQITFDGQTLAPGVPPLKDPEGVQMFNGRFLPRFEAAYDDWVKQGKSPWDFIQDTDKLDALKSGLRTPRELAEKKMAAVAATEQAAAQAHGQNLDITAPPAPAGVDPTGWSMVLTAPPVATNGTPWPLDQWYGAIAKLHNNPTPVMKDWFNYRFGKMGYNADDVLTVLTPQKAANVEH